MRQDYRPLSLLAVTKDQINAQFPYNLPLDDNQLLVIRRGERLSGPARIRVAAAQPGIFTTDQTGRGQGVVVGVSSTTRQQALADVRNPVRAGDVVVIFCAGLGAVNPPVVAGAAAPSREPLARTLHSATVTIGGRDAEVFLSGLAPGFAGLYQVNAFVPAGVEPGDTVPVVLTVAGQSSPPVAIAVEM